MPSLEELEAAQQERLRRKEAELAAAPKPEVAEPVKPPKEPIPFGDNILPMTLSGLDAIRFITRQLQPGGHQTTGELAMAVYELHVRLSRIEAALIKEVMEKE